MGLIGFICPEGSKNVGTEISFINCLKCIDPCLPMMIRIGIIKTQQFRGTSISATSLTGCMRQTYLSRTMDYHSSPKNLIYSAFRGSIIHQILQNIKNNQFMRDIQLDLALDEVLNDFVVEKRFYKTFECTIDGVDVKIPVSGQIDVYQKSTRVIHDYKTMGDAGLKYIHGAKDTHIIQTNFYKWLVEDILPVDRIKIHYITMKTTVSTGAIGVDGKFIKDVPIIEKDKLLEGLGPKIIELYNGFTNKIEPSANGGDGAWLCNNCAFKNGCSWHANVSEPIF